jgi:hypothetical protein
MAVFLSLWGKRHGLATPLEPFGFEWLRINPIELVSGT